MNRNYRISVWKFLKTNTVHTLLETPGVQGRFTGSRHWRMSTSTEFRSAPFFLTSHFLLFILFFSFHSFFSLFFFLEYYPEIVVCFPFFFRLFTSSVIEGDLFDNISPAVCRTHILLRLVCSGGIALILSLTGVIGIWWWVGQNRTQPLLFGLLILPAWDIIDPAVSDRKWIDCGPLTLHIGCFYPNECYDFVRIYDFLYPQWSLCTLFQLF